MAKKRTTRRVPQSSTPRMYGDGRPSQAARAAAKAAAPATRAATASPAANVRAIADLPKEYGYVVGDLKRLGIIASALFAVLVVLKVIIH